MRWLGLLVILTLVACGGPQSVEPPSNATPLEARRLVGTWQLAPPAADGETATSPQRILILYLGEDRRFTCRAQTTGPTASNAVAEGFWRTVAEGIEVTVLTWSGGGVPAPIGDGSDTAPEAPVVVDGWFQDGHLVLHQADGADPLSFARIGD